MALHTPENDKAKEENVPTSAPAQQSQQTAGDDPFAGLGVNTLSGGVDKAGFHSFSEEIKRLAQLPEIRNKVKVVPVTNQSLLLPVLAVVAETPKGVIVYSLLIEGMLSAPIEPYIETRNEHYGGPAQEIVIDRPTTRAYDTGLRKVVSEAVAASLGCSVSNVVHYHHCVVPRAVDLLAPEVTRVFFDSAMLALTNYAGLTRGVTNANLTARSGEVVQRTTITPGGTRISRTGNPIAADFHSTLELRRVQPQNQRPSLSEIHTGQEKFNLAGVSGFVDMNACSNAPVKQSFQGIQGQPIQPGFMPVVVLTEVEGLANDGHSLEDLRTQLLGIAASTVMLEAHTWVRVFESNPGAKTQKTCIGHLGIEYDPRHMTTATPNLGKVEVESIGFNKKPKPNAMTPLQVANDWCTSPVVALDVEQGGRLAWVQDVFVAAAIGDGARRIEANKTIIAECDALTGGIFSKLWDEFNKGVSTPVIDANAVTVHLGTYTGADGTKKDIRQIDYLTMLASMPKDIERLVAATMAQMPGSSNQVTVSDRRHALTNLAGDLDITGLATRVYGTAGFVPCLLNALIQSGVKFISNDSLGYDNNSGQRVGMNYNMGIDINNSIHVNSFGNQQAGSAASNYAGWVNGAYHQG